MVSKGNNNDSKKEKVVVSSLKEDTDENVNVNEKNKRNINNIKNLKENENNNNKENKDKIGFLKTFYYSTIRLDKIQNSIESSTSWVKYIFVLLLLLSVIMGMFLGIGMNIKTRNLEKFIQEMPDIVLKNGKLEGDIDTIFTGINNNRMLIINTVDSLIDIKDKYKERIDDVDSYILLTKDTIYVEPGESLKYSELNMFSNKTITKVHLIEIISFLFETKVIIFISGFLASMIILSFITILAFVSGRFIITILTIYDIKTYDFKKINKMAIFLTTMPFLIYIFLTFINQLYILDFRIDSLLVFLIVYLFYIIITIKIIKKKTPGIKTIDNMEDLKEVLNDISKNTIDNLEEEKKHKQEEKRKLKEKQKKNKDNKDKEKKEIVEGA